MYYLYQTQMTSQGGLVRTCYMGALISDATDPNALVHQPQLGWDQPDAAG